jgi:hypothetical protein
MSSNSQPIAEIDIHLGIPFDSSALLQFGLSFEHLRNVIEALVKKSKEHNTEMFQHQNEITMYK